jgi:hypothetical protein
MFFEFSDGDSLRMIDESRRAPAVDERFENALGNTRMALRHAVDRRLRRLGVSRLRLKRQSVHVKTKTSAVSNRLSTNLT